MSTPVATVSVTSGRCCACPCPLLLHFSCMRGSIVEVVRHGAVGTGQFFFGSKPFRNNRSTRGGGGGGLNSYGSFRNGPE